MDDLISMSAMFLADLELVGQCLEEFEQYERIDVHRMTTILLIV
jgi:hypothetical protein